MHANDFICPPPRISQLRRNFVIARKEGVQGRGGEGPQGALCMIELNYWRTKRPSKPSKARSAHFR